MRGRSIKKTIVVKSNCILMFGWGDGWIGYQPGFDRSHYSTHCDIFFDVNGAVHTHVPQGWLIVPVYDV